jgi:hypothetical protein
MDQANALAAVIAGIRFRDFKKLTLGPSLRSKLMF